MIKLNTKGACSVIVEKANTAAAMGSGLLDVFATPSLIALMEKTASESIAEFLEDGTGTVGVSVNVRHISATPIGKTVRCESELIEINRKKLVFKVTAFDDCGIIGEGQHERFIINNQQFLERTASKYNS